MSTYQRRFNDVLIFTDFGGDVVSFLLDLAAVDVYGLFIALLLSLPLLPLGLVLWKHHVAFSTMQMTRRYTFL